MQVKSVPQLCVITSAGSVSFDAYGRGNCTQAQLDEAKKMLPHVAFEIVGVNNDKPRSGKAGTDGTTGTPQ